MAQTNIGKQIRKINDPFVQLLVKISDERTGRLIFPFVHAILKERITIDSIKVVWNDNKSQTLTNIETNKRLTLSYSKAKKENAIEKKETPLFDDVAASSLGINYKHQSVSFDDYSLQLLLPQKQSTIDNALLQ